MSRKERRAAMFADRKAARKAGFPQPSEPSETVTVSPTPEPAAAAEPATVVEPSVEPVVESAPAPEKRETSAKQVAANQQNAKHSTGPTSATGRQKVSQNALKTGLTGPPSPAPLGRRRSLRRLGGSL